jgi:phosphonopyruvate decarboxylase
VIDPVRFIAELEAAGVEFFVGVPDSLMKDFSAALAVHVPATRHIVAANEGNAVAIAMGHALTTGRPGLVYLQNSGLGNTINPLLSLVDPEVYGVPMILLIGWRGEPGAPDEPQHVKQGRITPEMLDAMEVPWLELNAGVESVGELVRSAIGGATQREGPVAIVVRRGAFAVPVSEIGVLPETRALSREEALKRVVAKIPHGALVVSTTGMLSRELFELRIAAGGGDDFDLLTVGGMGHASSIALGVALAAPNREVWCLDGDGAVLMHMGALAVIARSAGSRFHHVVFNNRVHDSVGGQPTAIDVVDVPALARATGYRWAARAATLRKIDELLSSVKGQGPSLLEVVVRPGHRPDLGRPTRTPREARARLERALRGVDADAAFAGAG